MDASSYSLIKLILQSEHDFLGFDVTAVNWSLDVTTISCSTTFKFA